MEVTNGLFKQYLVQTSMVNPQTTPSKELIGSQNNQSNETLKMSEMTDAEWDQFIANEKGKLFPGLK